MVISYPAVVSFKEICDDKVGQSMGWDRPGFAVLLEELLTRGSRSTHTHTQRVYR